VTDREHRLLERIELTHEAMHLVVGADAVEFPPGMSTASKSSAVQSATSSSAMKVALKRQAALPADAARPLVNADEVTIAPAS
jgi:hypothetical protein